MKKQLLRLLPVAAVLLMASCTDDQYDLSNVDTESRFTAKGLVIPLNMSPIMLDNIISIEEDGDIKKDDAGNYFFSKKGDKEFKSDPVDVKKITINKPADIHQNVTVTISLDPEIQSKWEQNAAGLSIAEIKADPALLSQVGFNDETPIISVAVEDEQSFNMNANDIDNKITSLDKLGIEPVALNVDVKLNGLKRVVEKVEVTGLSVELPRGLTVTDNDNYNTAEGKMYYDKLDIYEQRNIKATIKELNYGIMKGDGAIFDANAHTFTYNKACKVGGTATIKVGDMKEEAKLDDVKNAVAASYSCDVWFSNDIVVNKFSGGIYHKVEGINIDPVEIKNLPEILQEEGTSIEIANPQLYLRVTNPDFNKENPAFSDNFTIEAGIRIEGNKFMPDAEKGKVLSLDKRSNYMVLSPEKDGLKYSSNYDWIEFTEMRELLTGKKIPEKLNINVVDPVLSDDKVTDFELGKTYQGITGEWEFYANLSLTGNTIIKYTKEWDDWGSDDLDGLNVENATVTFNITKKIALDADKVTFSLIGEAMENGKKVEKKLVGTTSLKKDEDVVSIEMQGGPVKNIKGGRLEVTLNGKGQGINATQQIEISNLRMKVDGYYDKEF